VHGRDEVVVISADDSAASRAIYREALIAAMHASPHRDSTSNRGRAAMPVR